MLITQTDRRLIAELRKNARLTISELARALGLSRTTVQKRLNRLEENKVITGYTAKVADEGALGSFQTYVNLVVEPNANLAVAAALEKMPVVESLFTVSGRIDFIAIVRAYSPKELDDALDHILSIPGVKDSRSAIILATKFDRR